MPGRISRLLGVNVRSRLQQEVYAGNLGRRAAVAFTLEQAVQDVPGHGTPKRAAESNPSSS